MIPASSIATNQHTPAQELETFPIRRALIGPLTPERWYRLASLPGDTQMTTATQRMGDWLAILFFLYQCVVRATHAPDKLHIPYTGKIGLVRLSFAGEAPRPAHHPLEQCSLKVTFGPLYALPRDRTRRRVGTPWVARLPSRWQAYDQGHPDHFPLSPTLWYDYDLLFSQYLERPNQFRMTIDLYPGGPCGPHPYYHHPLDLTITFHGSGHQVAYYARGEIRNSVLYIDTYEFMYLESLIINDRIPLIPFASLYRHLQLTGAWLFELAARPLAHFLEQAAEQLRVLKPQGYEVQQQWVQQFQNKSLHAYWLQAKQDWYAWVEHQVRQSISPSNTSNTSNTSSTSIPAAKTAIHPGRAKCTEHAVPPDQEFASWLAAVPLHGLRVQNQLAKHFSSPASSDSS